MLLKGCLALSPGSLFVSFALCYSGLLGLSLSFSLLHSSKDPSPSYGNELCYGYEGEDEVCSKFPTLLAREPLGSLPKLCKSSLANQRSCRLSPDPEFPDKEMFMLSFFKRSLLRQEWGWKKNFSPTLDYEGCTLACMGMCTALFV